MTNLKRYNLAADTLAGVVEHPEGSFVHWNDYERLTAENARLSLKCAALAYLHYGDPNAEPPLIDASARGVEPTHELARTHDLVAQGTWNPKNEPTSPRCEDFQHDWRRICAKCGVHGFTVIYPESSTVVNRTPNT